MGIDLITYFNDARFPRLIRLNNPFGITISDQSWIGKIPISERKDRSFEEFQKYHHGILAGLSIIQKYYFEDKANTIEKLINKFARKGTELAPYYEAVSKGSGFKPRQAITWKRESIYLIINEIARYENKGRNPMITPDLFAFVWLQI
ncbi:MAG: hypothetical protein IPO78_17710 [Saprospiraceae bacterium]|nr:hypothetical protein [Saprospiraceae bacterium]MBK9723404.1 hypothetical protein [Saprospiraceae bacterium]